MPLFRMLVNCLSPVNLLKSSAIILLALCSIASGDTLKGPAAYLPERLEGEIFYVPLAQKSDQKLIQNAKSRGYKMNTAFFMKYHAPLVAAVRSAARQRRLSTGDQVNLFGWLVVQTHRANGIGYLWGGDLSDKPGDSWSTSGVGFDCSGFVWSVWEAIAPESVFANNGERIDASAYRSLGRRVIAPMPANQDFLARLRKYGRPGDVIIMPGHICLYGFDPRGRSKEPIVMENGQFWNNLDNWLHRFNGKSCEVRSCFTTDGKLMVNTARRGRALPPLSPKKPDRSLVLASVGDIGNATEGKKATHNSVPDIDIAALVRGKAYTGTPGKSKAAVIEEPSAPSMPDERVVANVAANTNQQPPVERTSDAEMNSIDAEIRKAMSQVDGFDVSSLPPPDAHKSGANHKPEITKVLTRGPQLFNDDMEFGVSSEDPDYDDVVEYRVRMYGSKTWNVSDRPYFKTSMPGYSGDAILEFQVVDSNGAASPSSYRKVTVLPRGEKS